METECSNWYDCIASCLIKTLTARLGVAHETEQDDYYRGQFIPKGARILPLDWSVTALCTIGHVAEI